MMTSGMRGSPSEKAISEHSCCQSMRGKFELPSQESSKATAATEPANSQAAQRILGRPRVLSSKRECVWVIAHSAEALSNFTYSAIALCTIQHSLIMMMLGRLPARENPETKACKETPETICSSSVELARVDLEPLSMLTGSVRVSACLKLRGLQERHVELTVNVHGKFGSKMAGGINPQLALLAIHREPRCSPGTWLPSALWLQEMAEAGRSVSSLPLWVCFHFRLMVEGYFRLHVIMGPALREVQMP